MSSHRSRRRLSVLIAGLAGVALAAFTAAPAGAAVSATTWTVQVGAQSRSGSIQGMAYGPSEIWIDTGDTVRWVAASMEPHTVSFIDAAHPSTGFDPSKAYMATPTPQTWISAPGEFRNSGVMATMNDPALPPVVGTYELTFTGPGDYTYTCYLHGAAMVGLVHVRDAGTAYPFSQQQYDAQANAARGALLDDGNALYANARDLATAHHVYVGASDMTALVMRFVKDKVTIKVGESVTFDANLNTILVPHTVTFGTEPPSPFMPVGDPTAFSGGDLASGVLFASMFHVPGTRSTFTVTFTAPGTYSYRCAFHDGMGMTGEVVVLP